LPTYEYACKECGQHTEAVQAFTDDPLTVCPHCGGPLRKVFGNIGISFKGSGFYKNDSRSTSSSASAASKGDGATAGGGDAPAKTDTAPKSEPAAKADAGSATPSPAKPAAAAS
jgi:putative FmdB family regulatory protein